MVYHVGNLIFSLQTLVERNKEVNPTLLPYSKNIRSAIVGFAISVLGRTSVILALPIFNRLSLASWSHRP